MDICWIYYQRLPTVRFKLPVCSIAKASCLVGNTHLVIRVMILDIFIKNLTMGLHTEGFTRKKISTTVNLPTRFVDIKANE
jgi:hypothetical protein